MIENLFKISMAIGILFGCSFLLYTNLSKRRSDKAVIFLNLFVLFFTLNNLQITLADYHYIALNFFERKMLLPFYVLIIPCFYTFVVSYLKVENKVMSVLTPSIALFVLEFLFRVTLSPHYYNQKSNFVVAKYAQIEEIVNLSFTLFLFLKVIYIFLNQKKLHSEAIFYDKMRWLKQFLVFGFIIILLWIVAVIYNLQNVLNPNIFVYYPLRMSSSLLIYWIAYSGFFNYGILIERVAIRKISTNNASVFIPLRKSKTDGIFMLVEDTIVSQKLYLNPDLTIDDVAKKVQMPVKKLSQILHQATQSNFTDYINSMRIENAKTFLVNQDYENYTVIAVGIECGFYSKSTFYRAFKKIVGCTPTEYKLQHNA